MHVRRLGNPWWLLTGATGGGLAWAVGLPVWAAAVIGVIVWLTTVLVFGFLFAPAAPGGPAPAGAHPAADAGSAAAYASRAHAAAVAFEQSAAPLSTGPLGEWTPRMVWRAHEIAASIAHLSRRSSELAALAHTLSGDPHRHGHAHHVRQRHAEVHHRMRAATGDLEAVASRFAEAASAPAATVGGAVERIAADLENIGYGVDIGEDMVDELLGPEPPSSGTDRPPR